MLLLYIFTEMMVHMIFFITAPCAGAGPQLVPSFINTYTFVGLAGRERMFFTSAGDSVSH